jgi:hypothetical protein
MQPINANIKPLSLFSLLAGLSLGATALAGDNDEKNNSELTPLDDGWHFTLAVPAILPSFNGEVGINGLSSQIDVPVNQVIRNLDMAAFFRGEISKGRFGFMADFITMSLSGSLETDSLVKTMNLHFDEIIGEPAVRWRLLEGPRGWLDVYAGVRYVNLYQAVDFSPNQQRIDEASTALVNAVGDRLRTGLGESELRELIAQNVTDRIEAIENREPLLPTGPLTGRLSGPLRDRIQEIIDARKQELIEAIRERAEAATDELRQRAQQRIDTIKSDLTQNISQTLESKLDTGTSRVDDWWDPFIGLRGRLNLSRAWYLTGRGDIGGFGVGSQLAWQVEAALGYQITRNIFIEAGYRVLDMNYQGNGLTYDVMAHGAQLTIGVRF